jgi:micrococcal nuclease
MKKLIVVALFCLGAGLLSSQSILAADEYPYCGSTKSDKYHYPSCHWAGKITPAHLIWFKSKADAEQHGYKPCGVCKP